TTYRIDPETPIPNPYQGLWILSYIDGSSEPLLGGGLVVTEDDVYELSSAPGQFEMIGAAVPEEELEDGPEGDEDEDEDEDDFDALLSSLGVTCAADDFSTTVCIMAIPAESPVHQIGS